ncbi:MAG TPA: hypothetical protein VKA60_02685 [Blastocatellia bacterium]|nr:hypothetical protein [Blastocatellia bacterium]
MIRNASRRFAPLVSGLMLIALIAAKPESRTPQAAQQVKPNSKSGETAKRLTVHEWGTFTSIAGRDGKPVEWRPLTGPSDLPSFVYGLGGEQEARGLRHGRQCLKCEEATIRMETPVLYFYAPRELTVSVSVWFPQGKITEWYPQARGMFNGDSGGSVIWGQIKVLPDATQALQVEANASHYYAARQTDAALVQVCGQQTQEVEKFLFYRGVGNLDLPLAVHLAGEQLAIYNLGRDRVATCIVFESRNGQMGYSVVHPRDGELMIERPTLDQTREGIERELVTLLTSEGLYEKEAQAMVATWRDSWFEDGLRVFYVVPRRLTDQSLQLNIEPRPTELVRVLVGRTEVITPEMEQAIRRQLEPLNDASPDLSSVAMQVIRSHGRFAEPILKEMIEKTTDERQRRALEQILRSSRAALE